MKKHNPLGLTPEELAEMQAFDAEVDQDDELTCAELVSARRLDKEHREDFVSAKLQYRREYNRAHREHRNALSRKYYYQNPAKYTEHKRRWREKNLDYAREYSRAYQIENRDRIRERENQNMLIWGPYGQRIKEARQARGWSQEKLAEQMGYKRGQVVAKYETGRRPIDWERFRAVLPEIGPQPEGYPARRTGPGRPRKEEEA